MNDSDLTRSQPPEPAASDATAAYQPSDAGEELVRVLDQYLADLEAGRAPSREKLLAEHPALASRLEPCLSGIEFIHRAARPAGDAPSRLGDFEIVGEVGRGGMGVVYEAQQISLKRKVALKVLRLAGVADREAMERFQREAETVAQLHHTNIVPIFAIGEQKGVYYYAMQFIEGRSLAAVSEESRKAGSPLDPTKVAKWGLQAAEALAHAHQRGVIHRDVKPSNLILDPVGQIWLTDFGLAKRIDDVALSRTGAMLGTPRYMSPEQASAAKLPVDQRTDIYSLGVTLYELATGRTMFDADTPAGVINQILTTEPPPPRRLRASLPRDLDTIILKCIAKKPAERYATTQALAEDLRAFTEGRAIKARRVSLAERAVRWARRHRRTALVAAISAAAAAVLVVGTLLGWAAYDRRRQGRILLGTEGLPLTARLEGQGHLTVREFTVPTRQPVVVPAGAYSLRLSGKNRVSTSYQVQVARRLTSQGNLALELRRLWEPIAMTWEDRVEVLTLDGTPALIVASGKTISRRDAGTGKTVWSATMDAESQSAFASLGTAFQWKPASMRVVRPTADLDGDGRDDFVWAGSGLETAGLPPGLLVAMSGKTGSVLWTFHGRFTPQGRDDGRVLGYHLVGLPLVVDCDGDQCPDLVQRFGGQGFLGNRPELQRWSWAEAVSGRTGRSLWPPQLLEVSASGELIAPEFEGGVALLVTAGRNCAAVVSPSYLSVLELASGRPLGPSIPLGFTPRTTPRFVERDEPAVLVLRPDPATGSSTLISFGLPLGRQKWEKLGVLSWPQGSLAALRRAPPEWLLLDDLEGDQRPEVLVPVVANTPPGDTPSVELELLDSRGGHRRWRQAIGERLSAAIPLRITVGPDIDGDQHREVFVAAFVRPPNAALTLMVLAISGGNGDRLWQWRQPVLSDSPEVSLDPLGWWQQGTDGWPQLLVSYCGDEPRNRQQRQIFALAAGEGRLAHTLDYPSIAAPLTADLDQDGILDVLVQPHVADLDCELQAVRGGPPELWRRLESCLPIPDVDADGVEDLLRLDGVVRTACFSGRTAELLWQTDYDGRQAGPQAAPGGDLDGDGTPDVLHYGLGVQEEPMHAISGRTGRRLWSALLPTAEKQFFHALSVAADDLDADGKAEVIFAYDAATPFSPGTASQERQRWLVVLSGRDGVVRWRQPLSELMNWTQLGTLSAFRPGVGDLDGDGVKDVAVWAVTADHTYQLRTYNGKDGKPLWGRDLPKEIRSTADAVSRPTRSVSIIGDLDGDGRAEVVVPFACRADASSPAQSMIWALRGTDGGLVWSWQGSRKRVHVDDPTDPTPLLFRIDEARRGVTVLITEAALGGTQSHLLTLDAQGQASVPVPLAPPDARGGLAANLRVADLNEDGRDEILWIGEGKLHATGQGVEQALWEWPLPKENCAILDILPRKEQAPPTVAVWSGTGVYGLDAQTGHPRWRCPGPGAPARQLRTNVLGAADPRGLPLVMFEEMYDPANYANTSLVCRQAVPANP